MRPLKSASLLAKWMLRISIIAIVYLTSFRIVTTFSFNSLDYFVHLFLVVFAILLFVGSFSSRHTLTVLSSLIICILYFILLCQAGFSPANIITYCSYIVISFYFLANGNK